VVVNNKGAMLRMREAICEARQPSMRFVQTDRCALPAAEWAPKLAHHSASSLRELRRLAGTLRPLLSVDAYALNKTNR
jgi:hypothetical protein